MKSKNTQRNAEITKQEVAEACRKVRERGASVTRRSVIAELGRGSMTTVNRLMQQIEMEGEQLTNKNGGLPRAVKSAAKVLIHASEQSQTLQKECSDLRKLVADMSKELSEAREEKQALTIENRDLKEKVASLSQKVQRAEESKKEVQIALELF